MPRPIKEAAEEFFVISSGPVLLDSFDVGEEEKANDPSDDKADNCENTSHSTLVTPETCASGLYWGGGGSRGRKDLSDRGW